MNFKDEFPCVGHRTVDELPQTSGKQASKQDESQGPIREVASHSVLVTAVIMRALDKKIITFLFPGTQPLLLFVSVFVFNQGPTEGMRTPQSVDFYCKY